MKNIHIQGSHDGYFVPTVDFNAENGVCEISGESFLEETNIFYNPLIEWIKEYTYTNDKTGQVVTIVADEAVINA